MVMSFTTTAAWIPSAVGAPLSGIEVVNKTPIKFKEPVRIEADGWVIEFIGEIEPKTSRGEDLVDVYLIDSFLAKDDTVLHVTRDGGWRGRGETSKTADR
jgi:hypothetical protein